MKKNYLLLITLLFIQFAFSQANNSGLAKLEADCRLMTKDALNFAYKKDFNAYIKGNELHMDIDYYIQSPSSRIPANQIASLKDQAKEESFQALKKVSDLISDPDEICNFQSFVFHIVTITQDAKQYRHSYRMSAWEFNRMRENLNREDVYRVLSYVYN